MISEFKIIMTILTKNRKIGNCIEITTAFL
jgi:hypothetical protein